MAESTLKDEVDRLMQIKGNVRGAVFQTHAAYIRQREDEKGVKLVEEKIKELEKFNRLTAGRELRMIGLKEKIKKLKKLEKGKVENKNN